MLNSPRVTGKDVYNLLSDLKICKSEAISWDLPRPMKKNQRVIISGIVLSGKLTNSSVGLAIREQANLIIILTKFNPINLIEDDIFELLYQNHLFIISLNLTEFNIQTNGLKLITHILGGAQSKASFWVSEMDTFSLNIFFEPKLPLKLVMNRFENSFYWIPQRLRIDNFEINLQKIILTFEIPNYDLFKEEPNLVISTKINDEFIAMSWKKDIILGGLLLMI